MTDQVKKEYLPAAIINKMLGDKQVRVAIVKHPVTGQMAPCVPVADFADAFSQDKQVIRKMIDRNEWLQKYTCSVIMTDHLGRYQPHQCVFEEAGLGITIKLQPSRSKDAEAAAALEKKQEAYILILADVLRGFNPGGVGEYKDISALCGMIKLIHDPNLRSKTALLALHFYGGMPVDDLIEKLDDIEPPAPENSELAGIIVQYLHALLQSDVAQWGLEKGTTEDGTAYIQGPSSGYHNGFMAIGRKEKLPKFFSSPTMLGKMLKSEVEALEFLGWRRTAVGEKRKHGYHHYRYECMKAH